MKWIDKKYARKKIREGVGLFTLANGAIIIDSVVITTGSPLGNLIAEVSIDALGLALILIGYNYFRVNFR